MSEWKKTSIGNLCTIKHGFAYKGEYITNEECSNVLVTPGNFTLSGGFKMMDKPKYYRGPIEKEYILKEGDLIVTMTDLSKGIDTLGYSALVPKIHGITFHHNQRIGLIENISEEVDKGFLYWTMRTRPYQRFVANSSSGTTVHHTSPNNIARYSFLLPPLAEQKSIASFLSSLDDKIAINRRICENLEAQAQALFKHWFIDFAPFKNGKFVESELGMIPEGWRVGTLGDIAVITMGQSPAGSSYNEKGEGVIFYQGRTEFGFRYPSVRLYTTEPKRFAEPLSTLLSVRAPVGDINVATERCCIGRGLASIKSNNNCHSYIFYLLQSMKRRFDVYNGEGTVFGSINKDTLNGLKIIIPSNSILLEFEEIIEEMDKKILGCHQEKLRLSTLRDTLLPKLMSGQIKV